MKILKGLSTLSLSLLILLSIEGYAKHNTTKKHQPLHSKKHHYARSSHKKHPRLITKVKSVTKKSHRYHKKWIKPQHAVIVKKTAPSTPHPLTIQNRVIASRPIQKVYPIQKRSYPRAAPLWEDGLVFSLGGGAAFSSNQGSQAFPIINALSDEYFYYHGHGASQSAGMLDVFLGKEWMVSPIWTTQLGIGYNQLFSAKAQGTFIQGADVQSEDVFTYQYKLQPRQLLIENKWLYTHYPTFTPYLLAGVGLGLNSAADYRTNVPPFLTFTREYQPSSVGTSFSYTLGLGVEKAFHDNWRLGIGYRFADYGSVGLGNASIDGIPVSGTLNQSHFYTNGVLGQISWVN